VIAISHLASPTGIEKRISKEKKVLERIKVERTKAHFLPIGDSFFSLTNFGTLSLIDFPVHEYMRDKVPKEVTV
jgi:hypothetical protein